MTEVLRHPLIPLPLSLCHTDGHLQSTPKSALLNEIVARVTCVLPEYIYVIIIDVFFFLHSFIDLPSTIGQTATVILKKTCNSYNSETIHLVFDKMITPSIKDLEHQSQNSVDDKEYTTTGLEQKRPRNWLHDLRNSSFKTTLALVAFMVRYWANDHLYSFIGQKKLYFTFENDGYLVTTNDNFVHTIKCANLY